MNRSNSIVVKQQILGILFVCNISGITFISTFLVVRCASIFM